MRKDDERSREAIQELKREAEARQILENKAREFEVPGKGYRGAAVYYPGEILPLDGDHMNRAFGNLAMTCPRCRAHILLARFSPEDIWLLKARGLSNAEVGRLLEISRERVRQLYKKYEAKHEAELTVLIEADLDDLVKKAEYIENHLIASGRLGRRIDRRTKKKRIIAELDKLRTKEAQNERKHKTTNT